MTKEIPVIKGVLTLNVSDDASTCTINNIWLEDITLAEDIRFDTDAVDCVGISCARCILNLYTLDLDYLVSKGHITKGAALKYTLDLP